MLKILLLGFLLMLPAAAQAAEPAVKAGVARPPSKPAPKPPVAAKRPGSKPVKAAAGAVRQDGKTARPARKTDQAVSADPRMKFLQQFADADDDGDGLLSRQEAERNLPDIGEKFDSADASSDGWLTPEELRSYLQAGRGSEPHG